MKKIIMLLSFATLLYLWSCEQLVAQSTFICGFNGNTSGDLCNVISSESKIVDKRAVNMAKSIVDQIGLPQNFVLVQCDNISNAYAFTSQKGTRYIVIDKDWISESNNHWFSLGILAHEIGHHLCGHSINNQYLTLDQRRNLELEADRFAGFILKQLGANKEQVLTAINTIVPKQLDDSYSTHPSRNKRVDATLAGYEKNMNQDFITNKPSEKSTSAEEYFNLAYDLCPDPDKNTDLSTLKKVSDMYWQAIQLNPDYIDAKIMIGGIAWHISNHYDGDKQMEWLNFGRKIYKSIIDNNHSDLSLYDAQHTYHNLGLIYSSIAYNNQSEQSYLKAIENLNTAISINPDIGIYYYNRGVAYANYGTFFRKPTKPLMCSDFYKACKLGYNLGCTHYNATCR